MSEQLTKLAVDLSSFYNVSEEESIQRLFSGMSGETEAVRRLGIDISDTSLDALNKSNGDNRRLASLSLQEKSLLRFQKIILDTAEKQGDAARTAGGFANTMRRLQEKVKSLAIEMGQKLMPAALELAKVLEEKVLPAVVDLGMRSRGITSAFELLSGATVVLGVAFTLLNLELVGLVGILGTLLFAYEDLMTFLDGGNSILGDFIKDLTGTSDPLRLFNEKLQDGIGSLDLFFAKMGDGVAQLWGKFFGYNGEVVTKDGKVVTRQIEAQGRVDANKSARAQIEGAFQQRLLQAASQENYNGPGGFKDIYKEFGRSTGTDAEIEAVAKRKRADALRSGLAIATENDVAEGLAPVAMSGPPRPVGAPELAAATAGLSTTTNTGTVINLTIAKVEGGSKAAEETANGALRGALNAVSERKQDK
jgi:hypothetical protein